MWVFQTLVQLFKGKTPEEKRLVQAIAQIVGMKPFNLSIYQLALSHTSVAEANAGTGFRESNERLEYLGDAVLGAVVAEFLFKRFPYKEEGFLTEIRSRIVNRESLNQLALKIGILDLIRFEGNRRNNLTYKSMGGDALEALVGAVYLDKGFKRCSQFIIQKLLKPHFDLETLIETNTNFKSILIEWAQKENKRVRFEIISEKGSKHQREFIAQIRVNDQPVATGSGFSKKKAEQAAAAKCCEVLQIALG